MERKEDYGKHLLVGGLVALAIAYFVGVSSGKEQTLQEYAQEYSDEDYLEMKACYESVVRDKEQIDNITEWLNYGDDYEELVSAINEVQNIAMGKTVAVLKNPYDKKSGYYDCE